MAKIQTIKLGYSCPKLWSQYRLQMVESAELVRRKKLRLIKEVEHV